MTAVSLLEASNKLSAIGVRVAVPVVLPVEMVISATVLKSVPSVAVPPVPSSPTVISSVYSHKPIYAVKVMLPSPSVIDDALLARVTTGLPSSSSIAKATD